MVGTEDTVVGARPDVLQGDMWLTAKVWGRHLLCFTLPVLTLSFLATGPHAWYWVLPWFVPGFLMDYLDRNSRAEREQPPLSLPRWPFDLTLYALVVLQVTNIVLLLHMVAQAGAWSLDFFAAFLFVGGSSAWSGIVVAHELIHRRERHLQFLGRLMLVTVLYEHFYTEHLRGHHVRIATAEDPATARFGETFWHFLRRTVPAQFRSAWRLETTRLGDIDMPLWDRRQMRNQVLHGMGVGWGFALCAFALWGVAAGAAFVLQAVFAVVHLEAVNYFEHWGLQRQSKRVRPVDSWDTESWFTLHALVGLSRHADHHAAAARPYEQLRHREESPKLPLGYLGMVDLVITKNQKCRALLTAELKRRGLGPFAPISAESCSQ